MDDRKNTIEFSVCKFIKGKEERDRIIVEKSAISSVARDESSQQRTWVRVSTFRGDEFVTVEPLAFFAEQLDPAVYIPIDEEKISGYYHINAILGVELTEDLPAQIHLTDYRVLYTMLDRREVDCLFHSFTAIDHVRLNRDMVWGGYRRQGFAKDSTYVNSSTLKVPITLGVLLGMCGSERWIPVTVRVAGGNWDNQILEYGIYAQAIEAIEPKVDFDNGSTMLRIAGSGLHVLETMDEVNEVLKKGGFEA